MIRRLLYRKPPKNLGRAGERHAARWLRRRGYRTLARNLHVGVGEADLVCLAPDKRTVVIVEVKTRMASEDEQGFAPEVAVGAAKARKLVLVAQAAARKNGWESRPMRIDVVGVVWPERAKPRVRHIESAVTLS